VRSAPSDTRIDAAEAAERVLEAVDGGHRIVVVLDPERDGPGSRRRLVLEDGNGIRALGSLATPERDARADSLAAAVLDGALEEGLHEDLYLELHLPGPELVIVGAGHIAQPLSTIGALLGFRVTVLDDRPAFATRERFPEAGRLVSVDFADPFADVPLHALSHVVLVTRGHRYDYECLKRIVEGEVQPRYVGMIGSRRRVRATWEALLREGVPRERLEAVRAPVGLDLGAETPAEIAVSVAAELVLAWRGGSGRPLREVERVLERFFPPSAPEDA
jgi:xanthine dehydrogenase accessory factor